MMRMLNIFRLEMIPIAAAVAFMLLFFVYYIRVSRPLAGTTEWIERELEAPRFSFVRHPLVRRDILPIILIIAAFSAIAFSQLRLLPAIDIPIQVQQAESAFPPLGTMFADAAMNLFGQWRIPLPIGLGFGAVMIVLLYALIKNLFGKTLVAICGTLLAGPLFMYLQVSISTIDNLSALFVLSAYCFMFRYATANPDVSFRHNTLPLLLSGISFGIGAAFSWTVLYSGVGLLAVFIIHLRTHSLRGTDDFRIYLRKSIAYAALFFVAVTIAIYLLSYIIYGLYAGISLRDAEFYRFIWGNQSDIFEIRRMVVENRISQPSFLRWMFGIRCLLPDGLITLFVDDVNTTLRAYENPFVWWGGFMAIIAMTVRAMRNRDGAAIFILIGFVSQFLLWILPTRGFTAINLTGTLFSILALCAVFSVMYQRGGTRGKAIVILYTSLSAALFLLACTFVIIIASNARFSGFLTGLLRWIFLRGEWYDCCCM